MDKTDVAVNAGYIPGIAPGALLLKELTGWTGWVSYPIGALLGVLVVTIFVFFLIEFLVFFTKKFHKNH